MNPAAYTTPDVVADFTSVVIRDLGQNRVQINGGGGYERPEFYKASLGYKAFFLGESEISYAGQNCIERAELAAEIIKTRIGHLFSEFRTDLIGHNSVHRAILNSDRNPYEIRLRVAGKAESIESANTIGEEVEALYTNGPAGGGGVRKYSSEMIGIVSVLINRSKISPKIEIFEA